MNPVPIPGRNYIPGVPAAGHIATNGYWHPGGINNCHKDPCKRSREKDEERRGRRGR